MKRLAILTSGGDSPGMNAAIRSIVKSALHYDITPIGIYDGYAGLLNNQFKELGYQDIDTIISQGGTILGSARCEAFREKDSRINAIQYLRSNGIDGLIVIGGDGTFAGANAIAQEMDIQVIGIPGTIDNDIYGTDFTIGFDTALNTVVQAVDKIRDTASSHHRVFFVEVMGRDAGFLALHGALAAGAEAVMIPEIKTPIEQLVHLIKNDYKGRRSSIVFVAEGEEQGHAIDVMNKVRPFLEGYDLRHSVLGHIQRGGSPSAKDRILATRMGSYAVELLLKGGSKHVIGCSGETLITYPIDQAIKEHAQPSLDLLSMIDVLRTK